MKPDKEEGGGGRGGRAASRAGFAGRPTVPECTPATIQPGAVASTGDVQLLVTAFTDLCRTVRVIYGCDIAHTLLPDRDGNTVRRAMLAADYGGDQTDGADATSNDDLTARLAHIATVLERAPHATLYTANGAASVTGNGDESHSIFSWSTRPVPAPKDINPRNTGDGGGGGQSTTSPQDAAIIARALHEEDRLATEAKRDRERMLAQLSNVQPTVSSTTPDQHNDATFNLSGVLHHENDRPISPWDVSGAADRTHQLANAALSPILPPHNHSDSLNQLSWPVNSTMTELDMIDPSRTTAAVAESTPLNWLSDRRTSATPALTVNLPTPRTEQSQYSGHDARSANADLAPQMIHESRIAVGSERGSIAASPPLTSSCLSSPFNYKPPTASLTQAMLFEDQLASAAILAQEQQRHSDRLASASSANVAAAVTARQDQGRAQTAVTMATIASPSSYPADKHSPYCGTEDCTFCIHDEHSLPSALADFSPPTSATESQSLLACLTQERPQPDTDETLGVGSPTLSSYSGHAAVQSPIDTQSSSGANAWSAQAREVFSPPHSLTRSGASTDQPSAPNVGSQSAMSSTSDRNIPESSVSQQDRSSTPVAASVSDDAHSLRNLSSPSSVSTTNTAANRSFIIKLPVSTPAVDILHNYGDIYDTLGLPDSLEVLPMTPRTLAAIKATLSNDNPDDVRFWAVCMLGFYGMFQEHELPDPIFEQSSASPLSVAIKRNVATLSKPVANPSDVASISLLLYALTTQGDLCPHAAVCNWITVESGTPPKMFGERQLAGACSEPGRQWLSQRLEQALKAANIGGQYTLASLHLGGAVCAVQARASVDHIRVAAGWDAPKAEFAKTGLYDMSLLLAAFVSKYSSA